MAVRAPWQKLKWKFRPRDPDTGNLGTEVEIGYIRRISGTKGSSSRIDATAIADTKRKYVEGLPEKGELSLEIVTQSSGLPSLAVSYGDVGRCKLVYEARDGTESTLLEFDCLVTGLDVNVSVGDVPMITVKFSSARYVA